MITLDKCILAIVDDFGIDIHAIDGCSLTRHWYLNSLGTVSYKDVVSELCAQISWTDCEHMDCVCCLTTNQEIRESFSDFNIIDKDSLLNTLGCSAGSVLIETRTYFLLAYSSETKIWLKQEIYNRPACLLTEFADKKFIEIGCRDSVVGSPSYLHTKCFFLNLIEFMPEVVNVILVPVFASSGSDLLLSDRDFVELIWNEQFGEQTLGNRFEAILDEALCPEIKEAEIALVYNAFLKNKLFV